MKAEILQSGTAVNSATIVGSILELGKMLLKVKAATVVMEGLKMFSPTEAF